MTKKIKMPQETIDALHKAIDHWFDLEKKTEKGEEPFAKSEDCALCLRFPASCVAKTEKCPVFKKTGEKYCEESPYECLPSKDEAREEINFLISLLPIKEQRPYWYDD